ncbi:MAG: SPFH domain-containing protein [Bacteroidetes bacterium]|nr:SPFH domain-containing protein [Bacteroidota bacterium]MCL2301856.1 SPFH domain-containing protein [Lentimicrobiaceae bacterium]
MKKEKFISGLNGFGMFTVLFLIIIAGILTPILMEVYTPHISGAKWFMIIIAIVAAILMRGFSIIKPNEALVITFFGKYQGTCINNGFFWFNPFTLRERISVRARNVNGDPIKVNDKMGNPILIGIVLVWKVEDTFKASFDVDNYVMFVDVQSEAAVRNLAGSYPYDNLEDEHAEITLRGGGTEVNNMLEAALTERLAIAGIKVIEARISNLAYAPEIAGAMLQRQQATAIVAARYKIVEGAVSMVELALNQMSEKKIIELDDEKKAAMASNLLVVLTSDRATTPIVNAGTLYN